MLLLYIEFEADFVKTGYLTVDGNAGDRNNLSLWHGGDMLIRTVADGCKDTVVIIHAPGQVDMEQWIELDAIKGVIFAGMPGQESVRPCSTEGTLLIAAE